VIAYNPLDGAEIWRAECLGGEIAPSPIFAGGYVLAIEPYGKLVAIRPDGHGNITKTHIAWTAEFGAPDICSPVSNERFVFALTSDGTLSCFNVSDGTPLWQKQLRGDFKASPSIAGDRLYILGENGDTYILEIGPEYRQIAKCSLGERTYASPAFADGRIYIRGIEHLYCIAGQEQQ